MIITTTGPGLANFHGNRKAHMTLDGRMCRTLKAKMNRTMFLIICAYANMTM